MKKPWFTFRLKPIFPADWIPARFGMYPVGPDDAELWRQHARLPNGIPIHM
jgi:hypothetical protein